MKKRILGTDLEVSAVSMGCMGLSHASGDPEPEDKALAFLFAAMDSGYTFFDTAETYGFEADPHHNEKLVGKAFKGIRHQYKIATKFGVAFDYSKNPYHPSLILDSRPETIRKSIDGSLKRLQTDYVDLYYQHRIDPDVPAEEVAGVMSELIKEGKILHWGISMTGEDYLRKTHAVCPVTAIQNVYSILKRDDEALFPVLEELNVGYVSCVPLAKGFLSGAYSKGAIFVPGDYRGYSTYFTDESFDAREQLLALLHKLADEKDATPGQIALAWMMCKKPYIVPIPGTRKVSRMKENAGAADVILTNEEISAIDALT